MNSFTILFIMDYFITNFFFFFFFFEIYKSIRGHYFYELLMSFVLSKHLIIHYLVIYLYSGFRRRDETIIVFSTNGTWIWVYVGKIFSYWCPLTLLLLHKSFTSFDYFFTLIFLAFLNWLLNVKFRYFYSVGGADNTLLYSLQRGMMQKRRNVLCMMLYCILWFGSSSWDCGIPLHCYYSHGNTVLVPDLFKNDSYSIEQ